ncbi:hypothetical protein IC235_00485 [Hymenobacter sp. BT664]|uniref:Uncharacterized protein n=1 Tax=Hymenobacter montanus TaxID=2771359 RepID=A0A927BA12_9BACT|nr:hypothetical protein [Hymenobacter montanus]MBD2766364.1 hypothetical protein [Hymenobacter montanus]
MKKNRWVPMMGLLALFNACKSKDVAPAIAISGDFTFESGLEGWQAGFADYPEASREQYELQATHSLVPANLSPRTYSFRISGTNHSDDLFMFLKKQFSGLQPNQTYQLTFDLILASQYPQHSIGVGGSPGGSVYLKAGASQVEPNPVLNGQGFWLMNIDKSNQSQPGRDMQMLGTVGIEANDFVYERITRTNRANPMRVTADGAGKLWLIVGTDSGFEANTTLYYDEIKVHFQPVE